MAKYRLYNVQLLPNTSEIGEVGVAGYKKLFSDFRNATEEAKRSRKLPDFHQKIGRDDHFGPYEFHVGRGFVWGYFTRYTRTIKVDDLYTKRELYKEGKGKLGFSNLKEIRFLFDCRQHFFAIEEAGNALPKPADMVTVLKHYLQPFATAEFPKHELHIILMADKKSLDVVFEKAVAFSRIEVDLTFPNGPAECTLDDLKRARLQKLHILGSSGANGRISKDLPRFLIDVIKGSIMYGKAKLAYFVSSDDGREDRREIFSTELAPLTIEKRQSAKEDDKEFAQRCVEEIRSEIGALLPAEVNDQESD